MSIFLETHRLNSESFSLSDTCIKVHGEDAFSYLQSQTTNDVSKLENGRFHLNSILDTAGKIISAFVLLRKNQDEFYVIVSSEFAQGTFDRIEKYHIAEEFEVEILLESTTLKTNTFEGSFKGSYFFENDTISFEKTDSNNKEVFKLLSVLSGVPRFGEQFSQGELINNTRFDELAVDYAKGCYPGQETVAKIHTRRGAAFKPVLIKLDSECKIPKEKIYKEDKKIGEVRDSISYEASTYIYATLNRENRINDLNLLFQIEDQSFLGLVKYYPYLSPTRKDLAIELYDLAVDFFHKENNEKAIEYFYKAIEVDPSLEDAYESLGVLYGRLEQYGKAIELMEKLKEINPKCMMALTNLSLFHMKIGNIDTAEKFKADATLLNFQVLGDEAKIKREKEELAKKKQADRDRREGMFQQVLEMDPEDAMANNGMGEITLERGEYETACEYFQAAIRGNKNYSVAYLGLAKAYYQLQNSEKLKETLELGISIASKNGDLMPANEMQAMLVKS